MSAPSANETWIIESGNAVIQKRARGGALLTPLERLIYCLWVADYGMRNAGDLDTAHDLYADFQTEAVRLAIDLRLQTTHEAFALSSEELQRQYFGIFDKVCDEIKRVSEPSAGF